MSVQTLYTAATGMQALETKLETIANNLANVNTVAFKRDRANFEDLFYKNELLPGRQDAAGQFAPTGVAIGMGTRVSSTQTDHGQGAFQETGNPLDIAISGKGFFQVTDPSGEIYYTRAGNFDINANGDMVVGSASLGRLLEPQITFPPDITGISISPDGIVEVQQAGAAELQQIGQIQLAYFVNPDGLLKLGENLYQETSASGAATIVNPGSDGVGVLRQAMLESSNVEPVQELIDLITTQRAFELNSQAVQAGDQILQQVTNLRRF